MSSRKNNTALIMAAKRYRVAMRAWKYNDGLSEQVDTETAREQFCATADEWWIAAKKAERVMFKLIDDSEAQYHETI